MESHYRELLLMDLIIQPTFKEQLEQRRPDRGTQERGKKHTFEIMAPYLWERTCLCGTFVATLVQSAGHVSIVYKLKETDLSPQAMNENGFHHYSEEEETSRLTSCWLSKWERSLFTGFPGPSI